MMSKNNKIKDIFQNHGYKVDLELDIKMQEYVIIDKATMCFIKVPVAELPVTDLISLMEQNIAAAQETPEETAKIHGVLHAATEKDFVIEVGFNKNAGQYDVTVEGFADKILFTSEFWDDQTPTQIVNAIEFHGSIKHDHQEQQTFKEAEEFHGFIKHDHQEQQTFKEAEEMKKQYKKVTLLGHSTPWRIGVKYMKAKYSGTCAYCNERVLRLAPIAWTKDMGPAHLRCELADIRQQMAKSAYHSPPDIREIQRSAEELEFATWRWTMQATAEKTLCGSVNGPHAGQHSFACVCATAPWNQQTLFSKVETAF